MAVIEIPDHQAALVVEALAAWDGYWIRRHETASDAELADVAAARFEIALALETVEPHTIATAPVLINGRPYVRREA